MGKAIRTSKFYNSKQLQYANGFATIVCNDGDCSIDSDVEILGIEINFSGKAEITPTLPDNWIMQGNNKKIIIFTIFGTPITKHQLFTYIGQVDITKVILANKQGQKIASKVTNEKSDWVKETTTFLKSQTTWDEIKDRRKKGVAKKTKFNLPDYDLPKVDKKIIKKLKQEQIQSTTPTYTTGGGSSGGSGGY
tara:strand:- start:33 stop:611 length:579 start_codon:yes stop_codon:yes gene_type:complete